MVVIFNVEFRITLDEDDINKGFVRKKQREGKVEDRVRRRKYVCAERGKEGDRDEERF